MASAKMAVGFRFRLYRSRKFDNTRPQCLLHIVRDSESRQQTRGRTVHNDEEHVMFHTANVDCTLF